MRLKRTVGHPIDEDKMVQALYLLDNGYKQSKIARILGVHTSQITRYKRYREERKLSTGEVLTLLQTIGIMISLDGTNAPLTTHTAKKSN